MSGWLIIRYLKKFLVSMQATDRGKRLDSQKKVRYLHTYIILGNKGL